MNLLDNPMLLSMLFYPRQDKPGHSFIKNAVDGTIPVENDIVLGYRFYPNCEECPLVLYFHGNGEIASDYDDISQNFKRIDAALLVVDYRGYGWSTGRPLVSALLSDVEAMKNALPTIIPNFQNRSLYVMGRSLGSVPAIQIASLYPELFKGLIIESGFASGIAWLISKGLAPQMFNTMPDPIGNAEKLKKISLPLLIIHGEQDTLIPISNAQILYESSPSEKKRILRIPGAGHNDLLWHDSDSYFAAIKALVEMR